MKYNDSYLENIKKIEEINSINEDKKSKNKSNKTKYIPITVLHLTLNNKKQIQEDLNKLKIIKTQINSNSTYHLNQNGKTNQSQKIFAIQIEIEKFANSNQAIINNLRNDFDILIGIGGLNKTNRFFLENTQIDFLQDAHSTHKKTRIDFIHHLNSGLNHVLCKFAQQKNISLIHSLNFAFELKKHFISKEIGRINQNLKLARKYKIDNVINFVIEKPNEIKSQLQINGIMSFFDMSTQQKTNSFKIIQKKLNQNKKRQNPHFICEGIEFVKE